jgi:hypothetical protein
MKDKPDRARTILLRAKRQLRRVLADYDARIAGAVSSSLAVPKPARPAPEKRAQRRRCDARIKHNEAALERARRAGPAELHKYMRRDRCRNWALPGSKRCGLHGGHSTGPTTTEGKARTIAAMKEGRARWIAELKAEGKPIPFGRKKGGRNRSPEERAQAAYEESACAKGGPRFIKRGVLARPPEPSGASSAGTLPPTRRAWNDFKPVVHFGPTKSGKSFSYFPAQK